MTITNNSEFKDSKGRWRTQSLFLEVNYHPDAIYTMKNEDHHTGIPSFSRLYINIGDPTEYQQAGSLLGGWDHWQVLCSSKWFQDYIIPIREELEIKLRSEALIRVKEMMDSNTASQALQAARWLADGSYKKKRGRPSNEEAAAELRKQNLIKKSVEEDYLRVVSEN